LNVNINGNASSATTATFANNIWNEIVTAVSTSIALNDFVTVTAAGQTITLPTTTTNGDKVKIGVLNFIDTLIVRNTGQYIMQIDDNMTINLAYACIILTWLDGTWLIS